MLHQGRHPLVGLGHGRRIAQAQRQTGSGTGDHQLTDQVDQLIELAHLDLDEYLFVGALVFHLLLLVQRRRNHWRCDQLLFDQQRAERRRRLGRRVLQGQDALQLVNGERAAPDQDFAEAGRRLRQAANQADIGLDGTVRRQDQQLAVFADELESLFDGLLAGRRLQFDLEAQVIAFRIEFAGRWDTLGEGMHIGDTPKLAEVTQERQRIHAVAQHVGIRPQRDVPEFAAHRLALQHIDATTGLCLRNQRGRHRLDDRCLLQVIVQLAEQVTAQVGVRLGGLSAVFDRGQQTAEVVAAGQQQRQHGTVQLLLAIAHFIQQAFHDMGEADQRLQAKQTGRALDGVGGAEDCIDPVGIAAAGFDVQQRFFHRRQQLAALLHEGAACLVQVHARPPQAAEGITSGSPSSATRLSRSSTSRTQAECWTNVRRLPCR
ncbi:hypothetical protein D9M68_119020 [compost metagenome]